MNLTLREKPKKKSKFTVGWKEWCSIPELKIPAIKAKIDTGAKSCALHATNISVISCEGRPFVRFSVDPIQAKPELLIECIAPLADRRLVMNSGGHKEMRYIIRTFVNVGIYSLEVDISLTDRELLSYRMLIGREALRGRALIDPAHSHCQGKLTHKDIEHFYRKLCSVRSIHRE